MLEQKLERYCRAAAFIVGQPYTEFSIDNREILVQGSKVDGATQNSVPETLRARFLHLNHYLLIARRSEQRCKFDTLRQKIDFTCRVKYTPLSHNI